MAAAQAEKYADSAVGNVTGSNSVNVFLGLGLPWVIAVAWSAKFTPADGPGGSEAWNALSQARYEARFGSTAPKLTDNLPLYYVPAGSLGFSVVVFIVVACTCVVILMIRRKVVGGELGGTGSGRLISCIALCSLWMIYILMSILQAYGWAGLGDVKIGSMPDEQLSDSIKYWLTMCDKRYPHDAELVGQLTSKYS